MENHKVTQSVKELDGIASEKKEKIFYQNNPFFDKIISKRRDNGRRREKRRGSRGSRGEKRWGKQ